MDRKFSLMFVYSNVFQPFTDAILVKSGHECDSSDDFLGQAPSASECAQLCKEKTGCKSFVYGTRNTHCYMEKHDDTKIDGQKCNGKSWKKADYSFYSRKEIFE